MSVPIGDPAKLRWSLHNGKGFYPAEPNGTYDAAYFEKYVTYAATELGQRLTAARVALVRRHMPRELEPDLIDVGIGCGAFVEALGCLGFDVNPAGVAWLQSKGRWVEDLHATLPIALTFWDSFEHIERCELPLYLGARYVFLSLPVFDDQRAALKSKHFRPDEHYHFFTQWGLVKFFHERGYRLLEQNQEETRLGRDGIDSYAFMKR